MSCVARTHNDWNGWEETIREGYYIGKPVYEGFGREKAYLRHGMSMQPIINVLTFSFPPRIEGTDRVYGMTHLNPDGNWDLGVRVVVSEEHTWHQRGIIDGHVLGVHTAYCLWPYKRQTLCDPSINGTGELGLGGDDPRYNDGGWNSDIP